MFELLLLKEEEEEVGALAVGMGRLLPLRDGGGFGPLVDDDGLKDCVCFGLAGNVFEGGCESIDENQSGVPDDGCFALVGGLGLLAVEPGPLCENGSLID